MFKFFHTNQAAERLGDLQDAVVTLQSELRNLRMTGLATAILELLTNKPDVAAVRIAITQEEAPLLTPAVGENRWLHCSISLEPQGTLVDLPISAIPASLIGEGEFRAERKSPRIDELLALFGEDEDSSRAQAVFVLAQSMDSSFMHVFHASTTNVLT
jgi:hypothetical protein